MQLAQIDKEVERLETKIKKLGSLKLKTIQKRKIRCVKCKKYTEVKKWDFIQRIVWVPPYSCTGGGYHRAAEARICSVLCPKCNHANYIYNHPSKDKIVSFIKETPFSIHDIFNRLIKEDE